MTESERSSLEDSARESVGRGALALAMARRHRRVLVLLLLVLTIFVFRRPLMEWPAELLDVGEAPVAADMIYLLNGSMDRSVTAAELFREGYAPRIVVSRVPDDAATKMGVFPNRTDASVRLLQAMGVPDSAIVMLNAGVTSTADEAAELRGYLSRNPVERVLLVTNTYHTRRARWLMRRHLRGIPVDLRVVGVPDPNFNAANWWRVESGMLAYFEEYLKFAHNWIYRRPLAVE